MFNKIKNRKAEEQTQTEQTTKRKKGVSGLIVTLILVGIAVVGGVIIAVIVANAGDDAGEDTAAISERIRGDAAIYSANCDTNRAERVATIAAVEIINATSQYNATGSSIDVPWTPAGGYILPAATDNFAAGHLAAGTPATEGSARITGAAGTSTAPERIGFFAAASRLTEARYNADFDGDGEISSSEVVGVFGAATTNNAESEAATNAGGVTLMFADPSANIPNNTIAVGRRLVVNNSDSCWRIV